MSRHYSVLDEDDSWWLAAFERVRAALSEGFCPEHTTMLEPVATPPRRIAGHCAACGLFYGLNQDSNSVGAWTDRVAVPPWMSWRQQ